MKHSDKTHSFWVIRSNGVFPRSLCFRSRPFAQGDRSRCAVSRSADYRKHRVLGRRFHWDSGETTDACGRIDFSPPTPTPKRRAFRGPRRGWRLPGRAPSLPARCFRYYHIYEYIGSLGGAKYSELCGVLWAEHRRYRACERVKVSYQNRLLHTRVRNYLNIMVIELWMASTYATSHARIMGNYLKKTSILLHLNKLFDWLAFQPCSIIHVKNYNNEW